jgi:predicted NUDIX family NTP pyrophosphohydrolase
LLYRLGAEGPEVLLVHPGGPFWARRDDGAWSLPKGEVEPREEPLDVALREFEEELGSPAPVARELLVELGSVRQKAGKVVSAWCARGDFDADEIVSSTFTTEWPPRSGRMQEFPEVDRAAWFALPEARERILPAQAPLLDRLAERT